MSRKKISQNEEIAHLKAVNELQRILGELFKTPRKSVKNIKGGEVYE